jgi:hypothetical protein
MSFKAFIYYCAVAAGWAAFLAWGVVQASGIRGLAQEGRLNLNAALTGAVLGALVAGALGLVDSLLNARGAQRGVRVLLCMALGLVGGALGGLVGQLLNSHLGFPVFLGWMLAGVMIGASIGVFDLLRAASSGQDSRAALKKTLNGVYGGFLGGFLGGLPFGYLQGITQLSRSNLAIGLVLLGLCIGLLVGLAQVILKEAWVKVEAGFRAGREIMLSKDQTTIGRAEGCDIGLFGDGAVEKLHASILLKNNRYLLRHEAEDGETLLNDEPVIKATPLRDGDEIRLGKSVLRFGERQKRRR